MNKKGLIFDLGIYVIILFVFAIIFISIYMVTSKINDAWQDSPANDGSKNIVNNFTTKFASTFDFVFVMVVIGFFMGLIVIGIVLRSHPVFAGISILMLIVIGVVSVHLANSFDLFATDNALSSYATDFKWTSYLTRRLPLLTVIFGVLFIIVLYAKSKGDSLPV